MIMYRKIITKISAGLFSVTSYTLVLLYSISLPVQAQVSPPKIDGTLIASWIQQALDIMGAILIVSTLVMGVIGAYMWMTSTGDPGKVKQAQGTLTWAIIGLIFTLMLKPILIYFFDILFT
jgi:hypothetical protein